MKYLTESIANYIINLMGKEDEILEGYDIMKIHRLIYFCHGWYLALYDKPLINDMAAYEYGPIATSIFEDLQVNCSLIQRLDIVEDELVCFVPTLKEKDECRPIVDKIWELYGHWDGTQLSMQARTKDSPWTEINNKFRKLIRWTPLPIPDEMMSRYFKNILDESKKK